MMEIKDYQPDYEWPKVSCLPAGAAMREIIAHIVALEEEVKRLSEALDAIRTSV